MTGGNQRDELVPEREFEDLDPGRFGLATKPTEDPEIARDQIVACAAAGFNVLGTAVARLDGLPRDHVFGVKLCRLPLAQLRASWMEFQREKNGNGRVWDAPITGTSWWYITEGGTPAPTFASLGRLAMVAGLRDVPALCGRVDDGSQAHYWRYRHGVKVKGLDGQWREIVREKEVDLRNPHELPGTWSENRVKRAREHGAAMAQSKACARAIRGALGIPGSYSWEEASMPFAVPSLVWTGGDDPEVRRMVAANELGIVAELLAAEASIKPAFNVPVGLRDAGPELEGR